MKLNVTIVIILIAFVGYAQDPNLVTDFNEGGEDAFDKFNMESISIGDDFLFRLISADMGQELGILNNGQVDVLKDINIGEESSEPADFIQYGDKIYFTAYDGESGGVWVTDGTVEGTSVLFATASESWVRPTHLIVSDAGKLFFENKNTLYVFDGDEVIEVSSSVNLYTDFNSASNSYCTYKDGIAFIKRSGYVAELIYTNGEDVFVSLGQIEELGTYDDVYGIHSIGDDLIFTVSNDQDTNGNYHYNGLTNEISKLILDSSEKRIGDVMSFEDGRSLDLIYGQGYYTFSDDPFGSELVFEMTPSYSVAGERIVYTSYGSNLLFMFSGGFNYDDQIVYTDGTLDGTSSLIATNDDEISNMVLLNEHAFFATSISYGYNPEFYYVNMVDGTNEKFYTSPIEGNDFTSIQIMGIQNSFLYYIGNYSDDIGYEIYAIDISDLMLNSVNVNEIGSLNLYPNPVNDFVIIEGVRNTPFTLYSSMGEKLIISNLIGNRLDMRSFSNGVYFLELIYNGETVIGKIIKK